MKIIGIGTDILEVSRIQNLLDSFGDRFLDKILSVSEKEYCLSRSNPAQHIAGRFCAKEAVIKTLNNIIQKPPLSHLEIGNTAEGKPFINFPSEFMKANPSLNDITIELSISHSKTVAMATALSFRR
ncbi:MAG TPA: holo-[acyl-carrier-protein] synthase [Firmicutes bacterium]|nr:holo-[acyl-carrier-protein] synthase [Bacillota bacterium]